MRLGLAVGSVVLVWLPPAGAQKPVVFPEGVVNAASLAKAGQPGHAVTPGSLVSIFGTNLATDTVWANGFPLPRNLAGTTVTFSGVAAPLIYVSPGQINAQLPTTSFEQVRSPWSVVVTTAGGSSDPVAVTTAGGSLGIFTLDGSGCGRAAVFNVAPDGTVSLNSPQNSVEPGGLLTVFGTGIPLIYLTPKPLDGEPAPFTYGCCAGILLAGVSGGDPFPDRRYLYFGRAPGYAGLDQFNVQLSPDAKEGCALPFQLTRDNTTQPVPVSIHRGGGQCVDPPIQSTGLLRWKKTIISARQPVAPTEELVIDFSAAPGKEVPSPPVVSRFCFRHFLPAYGPPCPGFEDPHLDAGVLTAEAPGSGPIRIAPKVVDGQPVYSAPLAAGSIRQGRYSVTGGGGAQVGAFTASIDIPPPIELTTTFPPGNSVDTARPLTVAWKGGSPEGVVTVTAIAWDLGLGPVPQGSPREECVARASDGQLVISDFQSHDVLGSRPCNYEIRVTYTAAAPAVFQAPDLTLGGRHEWVYEYRFLDLGSGCGGN